MCGIAGGLSTGRDGNIGARLKRGLDALVHRGPDGRGVLVAEPAAIGMTRLAIVGIDTGNQPIVSEDGHLALVGNGEIYNAPELRAELEGRGHRFRGDSDIEVFLHLYQEMGRNALDRLTGMFALALLDREQGSIFLARDRVGIKPLFYVVAPGAVLFASEIPALRAMLEPQEETALLDVDGSALLEFLRFGYIPAPLSVYQGIRRLPPGHYAHLRARGIRVERWWTMPSPVANGALRDLDRQRPVDDWAEEVEALLTDSVRRHTLGDVPPGAFLSGGLDSGSLVALLRRAAPVPPPAFTVQIAADGYDEAEDAALTARTLGCEHHIERLDTVGADELVPLFAAFGEPFGDVSLLPTHRVARLAARHVKFVISGDGGDELFAGYSWLLREARWRRLPPFLLRAARGMSPILRHGQEARGRGLVGRALRAFGDIAADPARSFLRRRSLFAPSWITALLHPRLQSALDVEHARTLQEKHAAAWRGDSLDLLLDLDRRFYLHGDILEKVDRATMLHSLEARVPFLDHRLLELAARIPLATQLGARGEGKAVLRRIARKLLPAPLLERPKRGFGLPVDNWFRSGSLLPLLLDRVRDRRFRERELLSLPAIEAFAAEHSSGYANHGHRLWALLSLAVWSTEETAARGDGGASLAAHVRALRASGEETHASRRTLALESTGC